MKVFLTGGTGLVGSHLAERLRRRGDEVVCLQREGSDTRFLESIGCRIVRGDLEDPVESLSPPMVGAEVVVHGGALIYAGLPWERIHAVNVEGTRRIFAAALRAGVSRGVHLSSVATYGGQVGHVDETNPIDTDIPASDHYARSKREAEAAARSVSEPGGMRLTILRPSAIYGPRDRLFAPILGKVVRLPALPLPGGGHTTVPVVYAGNVASAVESAMGRADGPPTEVFNVGLDHPITGRELLTGFSEGLGRPTWLPSIPSGWVRGGAGLLERLGGAIPGAKDLPLTRVARLITEDNPYRTDRIRERLGWSPPFTHETGIAETTAWMRDRRD